MNFLDLVIKKLHISDDQKSDFTHNNYEFCPRCDANLTLQKGYNNDLPYWVCKGCGEMLINPAIDSDTAWICDKCGCMLNIQDDFNEDVDEWKCLECGFINYIDDANLYLSEEEYQADMNNLYKGLSDEDIICLMKYQEIDNISGRQDMSIVLDESGNKYVKKHLKTYDKTVYEYLVKHPISNMPLIKEIYESDNCLIVIEEFVQRVTLEQLLVAKNFETNEAISIALKLCHIVKELHELSPSIIHRDIKPSNIMISEDNEVVLLDVNAAKWMDENESQDTKLLGSMYYAAPEQFGYGFSASSTRTDIYALGVLLNVLVTGKLPKKEKAQGAIWSIIERCIKLNPDERYSDEELIEALNSLLE